MQPNLNIQYFVYIVSYNLLTHPLADVIPIADIEALPEDVRAELIDGELFVKMNTPETLKSSDYPALSISKTAPGIMPGAVFDVSFFVRIQMTLIVHRLLYWLGISSQEQ